MDICEFLAALLAVAINIKFIEYDIFPSWYIATDLLNKRFEISAT